MIQESHSWAYVWRKLKFQNIHTLQCSLQHCNKTAKTQKQYIYIYMIYIIDYYSTIKQHGWTRDYHTK